MPDVSCGVPDPDNRSLPIRTGETMKHPSSRDYFDYWNECRGHRRAPDRTAFKPDSLRHFLPDSFVLAAAASAKSYPVRVAGTRICARFGRDIFGENFLHLFVPASRRELGGMLAAIAEESVAVVAGVTATSPALTAHGFELLLLPFASRGYLPGAMTGLLSPFTTTTSPLRDFTLTSWRHFDLPAAPGLRPIEPRTLQKRMPVPGWTIYEGKS